MKMEEHIAFLKMLRIPYKEATLRAFWHILNDHREEVDIEDLIKATCIYQKPPVRPRSYDYRPRRRDYRDERDRRPRRRYGERDRY